MKRLLIIFNGTHVANIAREAQWKYPDHSPLVLRDHTDPLPPPEGLPVSSLPALQQTLLPDQDGRPHEIVLVANGGRTKLQVQTVCLLTGADPGCWKQSYQGALKIIDLQPDGVVTLFERRPLTWQDAPLTEEFTQNQLDDYFGVIKDAAWYAQTLPENWTEYFRR